GGRGLPRMEIVAGRETDFIVAPGPRFMAGCGLTNITVPGFAKLQYVQEQEASVTVRFVKEQGFTDKSLPQFRQELLALIGPEMNVEFVEVDDIPLQASGKLQYIRSEVARKFLAVKRAEE